MLFLLWIGFNLWPRKMEPPLFTQEELSLPQKVQNNSWDNIKKKIQKDDFRKALENLIDKPEIDQFFISLENADEKDFFKKERPSLQRDLSLFFDANKEVVEAYLQFLDYPIFVDTENFDFKSRQSSQNLFSLIQLSKIGHLYLFQKIQAGHWEEVHQLLLKQMRFLIQWNLTTRSFASSLIALKAFSLQISYLTHLYPYYPQEKWKEIVVELKSIPWEKINAQRSLQFEYLSLESFLQELAKLQSENLINLDSGNRLFFSPELTQKSLNQYYRYLLQLDKKPELFKSKKNLEYKVVNTESPFWFLVNPTGKMILSPSQTYLFVLRNFHQQKEALLKRTQKLIAE